MLFPFFLSRHIFLKGKLSVKRKNLFKIQCKVSFLLEFLLSVSFYQYIYTFIVHWQLYIFYVTIELSSLTCLYILKIQMYFWKYQIKLWQPFLYFLRHRHLEMNYALNFLNRIYFEKNFRICFKRNSVERICQTLH